MGVRSAPSFAGGNIFDLLVALFGVADFGPAHFGLENVWALPGLGAILAIGFLTLKIRTIVYRISYLIDVLLNLTAGKSGVGKRRHPFATGNFQPVLEEKDATPCKVIPAQ